MILDAADLEPHGTALDGAAVCVIGAGPAGLTVARSLAAAGIDVLILEAGGLEQSAESQDVYAGINAGDPYFSLDTCRLRYFGGTSNHWAGWSRPLDDHDFEARPHVPLTGWPISKQDIAPYLDTARSILHLEPYPPNQAIEGADGDLEQVTWRFAKNKRFAKIYRDDIEASSRIRLVLNANVVDLEADPSSSAIRHAVFRHYGTGSLRFRVAATRFVLACGGIENASVLLNANTQFATGIGNQQDLVGRNFLEHPHFDIGLYLDISGRFDQRRNFIVTTRRFIERAGILNCAVVLHELTEDGSFRDFAMQTITELCRVAPDFVSSVLGGVGQQCTLGRIRVMSEQAPNLDSRVVLSSEADAFGRRRIRLEWRKTETDREAIVRTARRVAEVFATTDMGRLKIADWLLDSDWDWPENETPGGRHHMGTTRMAATLRSGVVDADCRVFGHPNLYVAGSSVFPTVGYANPTLTIVQLALRLADHLKNRV